VLLLDEPTNHLDLEARNWLEEFLREYPYSFLIVSHDRYFLDVTIKKIVEVEAGKLTAYHGSYSYYFEEKQKRVEAHERAYEKQQEEIERTKAFIAKYKADKKRAGQTRDRVKRLGRMELIEAPRYTKPIRFKFPEPPRGPHDMLTLKDLVARYGDYTVFDGVGLMLCRGEKVAMVGPNGAGKSTLMQILSGKKPVDGGTLKVGDTVKLAYFGQDAGDDLNPEDTVYEAMMKTAPFDMIPSLRGLLGAFLFSGEDIEKKVKVLSGGEKSRLALAKLLLKPANLLLLDEPTNHLDLRAKEVLMNAFRDFTGTLVFVAHDRYFMEDLPDRILEVNNHKITSYLGDYTDYLYAKDGEARFAAGNAASSAAPAAVAQKAEKADQPKDDRMRQREEDKARSRLASKRKKRLEELEPLIEQAESSLKKIEEEMFSPAVGTNYGKIMELTIAKKDLQQKREALYQEWDKIQVEIEQAEALATHRLIKKDR
jgi:ATP-binding cassette subfamily F protein 3